MKHFKLIYLFLLLGAGLLSCGDSWLDMKSDKSLVVPTTIDDFQSLLNNSYIMNEQKIFLGDVGADDYYLTYQTWLSVLEEQKNAYVWEEDIYNGLSSTNWSAPYQKIFYANVVLDGAKKLVPDDVDNGAFNRIVGEANFFRADGFYDIAQVFCNQYNVSSAHTDLGIPLRLNSNPNEVTIRSNVFETYTQIIDDLKLASRLLPTLSNNKTRPSKAAAFALLARTYLTMDEYESALLYSDSCLQLQNRLMDYNLLNSETDYAIPFLNEEVLIHGKQLNALAGNNYFVDSTLYGSYDENDLRKSIFFKDRGLGGMNFVGSYIGVGNVTGNSFAGIAVDEVYLIRAECNARIGNLSKALDDINTLLETRWRNGSFTPLYSESAQEVLEIVLKERRKQLLFRGLRWSDLKRLNKDPRFSKSLVRELNGVTYSLPPNDPKYVYPIPPDVTALTGIEQNPRNAQQTN